MKEQKNKPVQITNEYLKCAIFHMSFYPLFVLVTALGGAIAPTEPPKPVWFVFLGIPLFLFYHLRDRAKKFLTLFLGHLCIFGLYLVLPVYPHLSERIISGFFLLIYLIYSLNIRVAGERAEDKAMPKALVFGMTCGALFFLRVQGGENYLNWMLGNLILCILFSLINDFLEEYCRFLFVNESSTGYIPASAILRRGLYPVCLFTGFLGLLMAAVCNVEYLSRMWNALMELLKRFTRWFFGHFAAVETAEEELFTEQVQPQADAGMMAMIGEETEPALIWIILQEIMTVAVLVFAVVFFFYAVVRLICFLRDSMGRRMMAVLPEGSEEEGDIREKLDLPEQRSFFSRKIFSKESNNDKVRRMFRKYVKEKNLRTFRYPSRKTDPMTVRDWEAALEAASDTERHPAYETYEEARYSEKVITDEDVAAVRSCLRGG